MGVFGWAFDIDGFWRYLPLLSVTNLWVEDWNVMRFDCLKLLRSREIKYYLISYSRWPDFRMNFPISNHYRVEHHRSILVHVHIPRFFLSNYPAYPTRYRSGNVIRKQYAKKSAGRIVRQYKLISSASCNLDNQYANATKCVFGKVRYAHQLW